MIDRRTYRDPTGAEAQLSVGRIKGPDGGLWWQIQLVPDDRDGSVAGQMRVLWCKTRDQARMHYRERLTALREAGWVRVE